MMESLQGQLRKARDRKGRPTILRLVRRQGWPQGGCKVKCVCAQTQAAGLWVTGQPTPAGHGRSLLDGRGLGFQPASARGLRSKAATVNSGVFALKKSQARTQSPSWDRGV